MRGNIQSPFSDFESPWLIRQFDLRHLLAPGEVNDRESVESHNLDEDATSRSVGIRLKGHGPNSALKFECPDYLVGLKVDDRNNFVFYGATDCVPPVRGNINIVYGPGDGDRF